MALGNLWNIFQKQGYSGIHNAETDSSFGRFYLALIAFSAGDMARAAEHARAAAEARPGNPVYVQAATYLDRVVAQGKANVYVDGEAFAAFIRGGGNIALYAAANKALREVYEEYETLSVLDIGVGDGLALLSALTKNITQLDLIEPSEAMLARTTAQLTAWQVDHRAHETTIQDFMRRNPDQEQGDWDVIEATWSLQSLPPAERPAVFDWMRAHGKRVIIMEFDVPDFTATFAPERVNYVVSRYYDGLNEYADDGGLVAQGFLMPVLFGYFDETAARTNWEGPIQHWADGLRQAGFSQVTTRKLTAYFWADAYVVDAQ